MSRSPASGGPAGLLSRRLRRERQTVAVMVSMYCREHHGAERVEVVPPGAPGDEAAPVLCPTCAALLDYADHRITACRFGDKKPTCARCTVHCFRASQREHIRTTMRYSGPRMVLLHPHLAVRHLLDRRHTPRLATPRQAAHSESHPQQEKGQAS